VTGKPRSLVRRGDGCDFALVHCGGEDCSTARCMAVAFVFPYTAHGSHGGSYTRRGQHMTCCCPALIANSVEPRP
jgi:hypothetical protein